MLTKRNGYYSLFRQKIAVYRKQYATYRKPDFTHPSAIAAYTDLMTMLHLAAERHIPVVLYTHPYHAQYLQMLDNLGLWPGFEAWKRLLVDAVGRAAQEPGAAIRLFDFAGFNEFSTEPIPPSGDRHTEMHWYWEPGHYKSALGEQILGTMFHGSEQFGHLLNAANIDATLTAINVERDAFRHRAENQR